MSIIAAGKKYAEAEAADEARRAKNMGRASVIINRRSEILKHRDKLDYAAIGKVLAAEAPSVWKAYLTGSDLDQKEIEATSRKYTME